MLELIQRLIKQLQQVWSGFSSIQKIVLSSIVGFIFVLSIVVGIWSGKTEFAVLYSNIMIEDSNAIISQLKEMEIEYRIANQGKTILVPQKVVYETRLNMAGQGLPTGGTVGFEIFDNTGFGITAFKQKVDYLRALQGELERTITRFDEVENARVHLAIPEDKLFVEDQQPTTASVIIGLKAGVNLGYSQIKSIANLLARSVEGLNVKDITIVDNNMNVLSDVLDKMRNKDKLTTEITVTQEKVRKDMEAYLKFQIETMLAKVLGPNRSVSRVFVEMDFNKKEIVSETFRPVVGKKGIERSTEETEEYYTGTGTLPGGIPGTSSNIPGYQAREEERTKSDYEKRHVIKNYEISKDVVKTVVAPGDIRRLSVSVFVDKLSDETVKIVEEVVAAAIGYKKTRGDEIVVRSLAFDHSVKDEMNKKAGDLALFKRNQLMYTLMVLGIMSLLIIVGLMLVFRKTKKIDHLIDFKPIEEDDLVENLVADEPSKKQTASYQDKFEAITGLAKTNPDEFAMLLKSWLIAGKE